jgi:hypothetical protein
MNPRFVRPDQPVACTVNAHEEVRIVGSGHTKTGTEVLIHPLEDRSPNEGIVGGGDLQERAGGMTRSLEELASDYPGRNRFVEIRDYRSRDDVRLVQPLGEQKLVQPQRFGDLVVIQGSYEVYVLTGCSNGFVARERDAAAGLDGALEWPSELVADPLEELASGPGRIIVYNHYLQIGGCASLEHQLVETIYQALQAFRSLTGYYAHGDSRLLTHGFLP